jgi:AcrR family transcriptional regulator
VRTTDLVDTGAASGVEWRSYSGASLPPILEAALACFVEHGYHGTSIRTIAAAAGLSVPGVYHHYTSKQALLVAIVTSAMEDLWRRSVSALEEAGEDVRRRLELLVECLVLFHAHRRELAFIAYNEIRSLAGEARQSHIAARDRQQRLMDQVVQDGVDAGLFGTPFPREVSRAVVTMCTGVSQWYRPGGELTPTELAERYGAMVQTAVGSAPPQRS